MMRREVGWHRKKIQISNKVVPSAVVKKINKKLMDKLISKMKISVVEEPNLL
jgi:hypothetical protein